MSEQNNSNISSLIFLSGASIALVGAAALAFPEQANEIIGLSKDELMYFSGGLIFIGCVEMVMAKTILKSKNTK